MLVPLLILGVGILFVGIFIWTFTYHIEIYIRSDSMKSRSSLIPLTLFSCSYDNGNYIIELNRERVSPYKNLDFRLENKEIIENYLRGYCFKIEGPLELDNFEGKSSKHFFSEGPTGSPIYRKVYLVPVIFDGEEWTTDYIFSVYQVKEEKEK